MSNESSDRHVEEVAENRDEFSVANNNPEQVDRFDNEMGARSVSSDEEDAMDAEEAEEIAQTKRSICHYISHIIFVLYVLCAAAMIVTLHMAINRDDIKLSNVSSLLSLHASHAASERVDTKLNIFCMPFCRLPMCTSACLLKLWS